MSNFINKKGQFQSIKYKDLPPDKIVLSFNDPIAVAVLKLYADMTDDIDLSKGILLRCSTIN